MRKIWRVVDSVLSIHKVLYLILNSLKRRGQRRRESIFPRRVSLLYYCELYEELAISQF